MVRTTRRVALGIATALVGAAAASAHAAPSSTPVRATTPTLPAATYKTVSQYTSIRMDDGVSLGATITYPSQDGASPARGRFGAVLSMTPYGRSGVCGCPDQAAYASRGIVSAVVDVRGTGGSAGNLNGNYFSQREARDSAFDVDWLGTRAWSKGKVGMHGGSYLGITQYLAAEQQPKHLAAIVPEMALSDLYRDAYTFDGVPNFFFDTQYTAVQGAPGLISGNVGVGPLSNTSTDTDPMHWLDQTVSTVAAKAEQAQGKSVMLDYLARPDDDPWYRARSPFYGVERIKVPVLVIDGWRDGAFVRGALEMYSRLARRKGVLTRLDVSACTHKGCGAPFDATHPADGIDDVAALEFDFLSHFVRGTPLHPVPPVTLRLQPSGPFLYGDSWPLRRTSFSRYFVHPSTTPALPTGDVDPGLLSTAVPPRSGSGSYATDPASGLSMALNSYGTIAASPYAPLDQNLETGHGLTWQTAPTARATRIVGPVQLHLVASSSASDTDWVARLSDVAPDGTITVITEGALRASHRALEPSRSTVGSPYHRDVTVPMVSGRRYAFDVALIPTAHELAPGHSLLLRLTSDDLPTRLPAWYRVTTAGDVQVTPLPPAVNTVEQNAAFPSWLLVPTVPIR
jgi:putative CocE/NonD family hydrolase